MAIVQISKIQQRSGNLVDLPQLDNGEFGWATDENRLFIGRTGNTYSNENIEVLTSYSNISFSQINGSDGGNFNITAPLNGQILTYVSSTDTWENYKGTTTQLNGTKLQLGNVSNLSMTGGAIGYVLQTDGSGNLSWTPKNTLYTTIINLTNNVTGNIITMKVSNLTPYTNGQPVTITGATISNSGANSNINGHSFYVKLNGDFATSGNVVLYTDLGLTTTANGAGLATYTANSGIATAALGGSGSGAVGGSNTTVQFNDQNISNGVAGFTFNKSTTTLTVSAGNIVTGNVSATSSVTSPVLVSNVSTGTAPLTVTSTTRVANLSVAYANVSDYAVTALQSTGTWYPLFVNATSGNLAQGANANLSFNAATGALSATLLTGTLTTSAQPNITSTGTLTSLTVTGNVTAGNLVGPHANGNSNIAITQNANITFTAKSYSTMVISDTGANITGTANVSGNANIGNLGTTTLVATTGNIITINSGLLQNGNSNVTITANANLTFTAKSNSTMVISDTGANITGTANVSGNANVGNLGTAGQIVSSIATGTAPFTVTSTTRVANLNVDQANVANYANVVTNISGIWYPTFVSGNTTANYQLASNANLSFNAATGALSATLFSGNGSSLSAIAGANVTEQVNYAATANSVAGANVSGAVAYATTANSVAGANVSGAVAYATTANSVAGANVSGTVSSATTAGTVTTAAQGNITSVGTLSSLTVTANVTTGGIKTDNYYYANGVSISFAGAYSNANVAAYLPTFSGTVGATALTTGANTTAGTITGNWGLSAGSKLTATYADLAEYYEADKPYEPGTVVEFGGDKEVTIAEDGTTRVAGVVSTDPAYVMNSQCQGEYVVALALQGRVPCKVRGEIRKGDMLVSAGDGYARPMIHPYTGSVIGKALENFEGEGVIEVAVGRL